MAIVWGDHAAAARLRRPLLQRQAYHQLVNRAAEAGSEAQAPELLEAQQMVQPPA